MTDDKIETPHWMRWTFRIMYLMAGITAVMAMILVALEAWLPALFCVLLVIWPVLYPWYWSGAYRLGHVHGYVEAQEALTRAWVTLTRTADRMEDDETS